MSDKSYVTMEQKRCLTCGCDYSTGAILMDQRPRDMFERHTLTGWGLCDEHQAAFKQGKVAMVEIDSSKSKTTEQDLSIEPDKAWRTGRVLLANREDLNKCIERKIPDDCPMIFVDLGVFEKVFGPGVFDEAPIADERSTRDIAPGSKSVN